MIQSKTPTRNLQSVAPIANSVADHKWMCRANWVVLLCASMVFLVAATFLAWNVPLVMDEVDYVLAMRNWRSLGLPIFQHGHVDPSRHSSSPARVGEMILGDRTFEVYNDPDSPSNHLDFLVREDGQLYSYGLWHPPLYLWLGKWLPLAGPSAGAVARAFNITWAGITFILVLFLVGRQYPSRPWAMIAAAAALLTCRPFLLGAPVIDVHTGIGPLFAVAFVATASTAESFSVRRGFSATVLLALVLGTSLSLGIACIVAFCVWRVAAVLAWARSWSAVLIDTLVVAAGVALFAGIYLLACALYELPTAYTFFHNFRRAATPLTLAQIGHRFADYALDLNPLVLTLVATVSLVAPFSGLRRTLRHRSGLFICTATCIVAMYGLANAHAYHFNKYVITAGVMYVFVVAAFADHCATSPRRVISWFGALLIAAVVGVGGMSLASELNRCDRHPYLSDIGSMAAVVNFLRQSGPALDEPLICDKDLAFPLDRPFYEAFGAAVIRPRALEGISSAPRIWLVAGPQEWCDWSPLLKHAEREFERVYLGGRYAVYVGAPPQKGWWRSHAR